MLLDITECPKSAPDAVRIQYGAQLRSDLLEVLTQINVLLQGTLQLSIKLRIGNLHYMTTYNLFACRLQLVGMQHHLRIHAQHRCGGGTGHCHSAQPPYLSLPAGEAQLPLCSNTRFKKAQGSQILVAFPLPQPQVVMRNYLENKL